MTVAEEPRPPPRFFSSAVSGAATSGVAPAPLSATGDVVDPMLVLETPAVSRFAAALERIYRSGWGGLMTGVVFVTGMLLALAWSVAYNRMAAEDQLLLQSATTQQENVALVVAENLAQVLDRGRFMAAGANDALMAGNLAAQRRLAAMLGVDSAYLRIALYDEKRARVFASSPSIDSPAAQSAISQYLETGDPRAEISPQIVEAAASQSFVWQVPLLFPVGGGNGGAGGKSGVLLTVLDLGYLLDLYRNIDLGESGRIHVLMPDGRALAEMNRIGLAVDPARFDQAGMPGSRAGLSSRIDRVAGDGGQHLISFYSLDRYPMVVAVSRTLQDIQASRNETHAWIKRILFGISAAVLLAAIWVAGNLRRQYQLLQSLKRANQGNRELIDQLEKEKQRAFLLAAEDHLTGLHNRRMFLELAASHLRQAKRSHKHYALMYLDLDRFKGINDSLGHHVGDLLLQVVSRRLRDAVRESDLIARLGGDEFAILLTGLDRVDDVTAIAEKLVCVVGAPCVNLDGHDLQVGTSIGIAIFPRDGQNVDMLCRHADAAMYEAKRTGRGRFAFYDAAQNPAGEWQFSVEQQLPHAIESGQLVLHFQPKVRLSDFRIVGLEALVRWQHPEHGLIFPKDFIPIAEESGLIVELGKWVAGDCCRQIAEWQAAGLPTVPIAFNVSARQLRDGHLPSFIESMLAKHQVCGQLLEIEITETALVDSVELADATLKAIAALGLRIALDDFGNGFSNLHYIRSLPINTIKIDRAFVSDLRNCSDDTVIINSIISLAHNLKMRVVAEGVESRDQIVHLKAAGCDEVQGYFLSRPASAAAILPLMEKSILEPL